MLVLLLAITVLISAKYSILCFFPMKTPYILEIHSVKVPILLSRLLYITEGKY